MLFKLIYLFKWLPNLLLISLKYVVWNIASCKLMCRECTEPVGFPLRSPSNFVLLDEIQCRANFARYQKLLDNAQVKNPSSTYRNFYVDFEGFSTNTCKKTLKYLWKNPSSTWGVLPLEGFFHKREPSYVDDSDEMTTMTIRKIRCFIANTEDTNATTNHRTKAWRAAIESTYHALQAGVLFLFCIFTGRIFMGSIENRQFRHQQRECALHNKKPTVQQSKGTIRKLFYAIQSGELSFWYLE